MSLTVEISTSTFQPTPSKWSFTKPSVTPFSVLMKTEPFHTDILPKTCTRSKHVKTDLHLVASSSLRVTRFIKEEVLSIAIK